MDRRRSLVIAAVVLVIGIGAYLLFRQFSGSEDDIATPVPIESLSDSNEFNMVTADGRLVPSEKSELSFEAPGKVGSVLVSEGDLVEQGDPLVQLDTANEANAIQRAEAAVALAESNLARAESMLELSQLGLDSAHLAVRDAKADLAILEAGPSKEQIAVSEQTVVVAEAGISQAAGNRAAVFEGAGSAELEAAEAQLAFAESEYQSALTNNQPILQNADLPQSERDLAALRINEAQAALSAAQLRLSRLQGGTAASERVAANSSVATASNRRDAAQAQLELLLAGATEQEIDIAKAEVSSAETGVVEAEGNIKSAETAVSQAEATLLEAQSGLAAAQHELTKQTLTAPFSGMIAAVSIKPGDIVQPGMPLITLADLSSYKVETTDLSELDIASVGLGMPAAVNLDPFPGIILPGEVQDIAASATSVGGDVTYRTTISLTEQVDIPLRWGMTAFVQILTDETSVFPESGTEPLSVSSFEVEGELTPLSFVDLALISGGKVTNIFVSENDVVSAGETLIELDNETVLLNLEQAEARVAGAEVGIRAAQNQLDLAHTSELKAKDLLSIAEANLALVKAGPSSDEIESAEALLAAAESNIVQAQAERNTALSTVNPDDIASAEANLAAAAANVLALEDRYQEILDSCFETANGQTECPLFGPVEEQTRGQLGAARASQEAAQALLDALNAGPTNAQLLAAAGAVTVAAAARDLAEAQLNLTLAGSSPEEIEKAEIAVEQAELGVRLAEIESAQAEIDIAMAEADLAAAEAELYAVLEALNARILDAPQDGTVTNLIPNLGETIMPNVPLITIADISGWLVETMNVTELEVPFIQVGDTVKVRLDAFPNQVLEGQIKSIAARPTMFQGDVVYPVTVKLDDEPELPLRWGMTAVIEFDVD